MSFRRSLFIATIFIAAACGYAQDTASTQKRWKFAVLTNLSLTLNTYSDNWAGGEFSAMNWGSQFNGTAERSLATWVNTRNILKLAFGQTKLQEELLTGDKIWRSPKKSTDLIDFESVMRFTLQSYVDPFLGVRAVSQFSDIRIPDETFYGNPLTLTESFGALRDIMKRDRLTWTARLGGAIRQKLDRSLPDSVDMTNDGGLEFVTDFKSFSKDNRLNLISQLKVYEALFSSKSNEFEGTGKENRWRFPDMTWENTLGVTLTKYAILNLYIQLLYDREIEREIRFRETTGLALTFSYASK